MTDLQTLGVGVEWPNSEAATAVRQLLAERTGLGRLAGLVEWAVAVRPAPASFGRPRLIAIDHELTDAAAAAAEQAGVAMRSVRSDEPDGEPGNGGAAEPTERAAPLSRALRRGAELADEAADSGTDLLVVSALLAGAAPRVITSVITNTEPVKLLARGRAAADPEAWMALAAAVRDQRRDVIGLRNDPDALLHAVGTPALALTAGLVLRAAARRTPVVLAGGGAAAAALLAYEASPRAVRWWSVADGSASAVPPGPSGAGDHGDARDRDPVPRLIVSRLGLRRVIGLGTGDDEDGTDVAAVLSVAVLRAAARIAARLVPAPESAAEPGSDDDQHRAEPAAAQFPTARVTPDFGGDPGGTPR